MRLWQSYEIPQRSISKRVMSSRNANFSELILISYVEKLLKDREWLTNGVQELYQRLRDVDGWTGPLPTNLVSGRPHVHSILNGLGILTSNDGDENSANVGDTAPLDSESFTTLKFDKNIQKRSLFNITPPSETLVSKDSRQPANFNLGLRQDPDPHRIVKPTALLPTPPTDNSNSSMQVSQDRMQHDQDRDLFPLRRGWSSDDAQESNVEPLLTEGDYPFLYMPQSGDLKLPSWGQDPAEQYDVHAPESPFYSQQSPTTQLRNQLDYFSLGMDQSRDFSGATEFLANSTRCWSEDFFLEENLNSTRKHHVREAC